MSTLRLQHKHSPAKPVRTPSKNTLFYRIPLVAASGERQNTTLV